MAKTKAQKEITPEAPEVEAQDPNIEEAQKKEEAPAEEEAVTEEAPAEEEADDPNSYENILAMINKATGGK